MGKRVLITGITGFVGSHLARFLLEEKYKVFGLTRWRSNKENLKRIINEIELYNGDLLDFFSVFEVIKNTKPDIIYHLASQSYVPVSYVTPTNTINTNINGTINLLEAIKGTNIEIIGITSSEVYGDVKKTPITEETPLRPSSPYGVSKVGQDLALLQYFISYGVKTIRIRNFTTTGAGRGNVFFESFFAKQLAAIKVLNLKKEIHVGNLNSIRVLAHVEDMIRAYYLASKYCDFGECYNVGGEKPIKVSEVLDKLIKISGLNKIKIKQKKNLLRPSDVTNQIPSIKKFKEKTNWEPFYTYDGILKDLYQYWEEELIKNPWKANKNAISSYN